MTKKAKFLKVASSLHSDGRRNFVHPADVKGRFARSRNGMFALLIAIYILLPWVHIGGHPAVFLDIAARRFYLFGATFNAQDTFLLFFLLSGMGFALFVATAVFGRVWCGYACPQTVFLEGVFRRIERWIEGPRVQRIRRNAAPMSLDKFWRKTLKHILFFFMSAAVAHIFISYFVSLPKLWGMMHESPLNNISAFLWVFILTGIMYFNFAWFREQMCLIICPYGRLQSVMTDLDTIVIGYDEKRGEPRGKKNDPTAGDCVDCDRCTVVCPTGIDIRNGLQLDCIGCSACIDACDEVMGKLGREKGLIRYDSQHGLRGERKTFWRPRLALYAALATAGLAVAFVFGIQSHKPFEANLLRLGSTPYIVEDDGRVQNLFEIHVVNKRDKPHTYEITPSRDDGLEYVIAIPNPTLKGGQGMRVPVFIYSPVGGKETTVRLDVSQDDIAAPRHVSGQFLRPR
tara:strand:- start:34341 stop:35714 length:1374 start_codon:yes stop_codon:yes gene_type:complete